MTQAIEQELKELPTWSYGLIAGVVALGGLWWYRKREATAVSSSTTGAAIPAADANGQTVDSLQTLDDAALAGETNTTTTSAVGSDSTNTTNNALWESQGVAFAGTQGVAPLAAQTALENYLMGNPLNTAQQGIVNSVLGKYGLAPEGTSGIPSTTTTSTATPAQKAIDTQKLQGYQTELTGYQTQLAKAQAGSSKTKANDIKNIQNAIAIVNRQIVSQSAKVNADA